MLEPNDVNDERTATPPLEPLHRVGRCPVCLKPLVVHYIQLVAGRFELRGAYPTCEGCEQAFEELRLIKGGWALTSRPSSTHAPHGPGGNPTPHQQEDKC